jgi:hypothetical protein
MTFHPPYTIIDGSYFGYSKKALQIAEILCGKHYGRTDRR